MNNRNMAKIKMIEKTNKERILKVNPQINENSGIYFLTREDEEGFKYAYIGQAKHILTRLAQHLVGYQHIDLSIKSHKLYSSNNPYGWRVNAINYPISKLDEMEQYYIKQYALNGYQLRNKTSGSQGKGKSKIDEYRPQKGYRDGLKQGYKNASRDNSNLFEKHLVVSTKNNPPTRYQTMALEKFNSFLNYYKECENDKN